MHITCRAAYGQRCSGIAEVREGGEVVGSTRYSLPARPGKAAATDQLVVGLDRRVRAAELRVTRSPLPPRPLLSPAKPSWDDSVPW